jgi:high-affinity Fe2+/Pb2+ permease
MDWSFALPVMFITLREGMEDSLVVAIGDFLEKI